MTASIPVARPITGRFVLIAILTFFSVVIGANLVMMRFAITTLPGAGVDSAYSASLAYEREIIAARQQNERSWQVQGHIHRQPDGEAVLAIEVRDRSGAPVAGMNFVARLERPVDRRADRAIDVSQASVGTYRGSASGVAVGQWDLVIEGDANGRRMFVSKNRVILN
ncbi:FixH family protein [Bradyrhizobium sp. USDA 4506]